MLRIVHFLSLVAPLHEVPFCYLEAGEGRYRPKIVKRFCPETCLNGANQSVDAQDNQYDTLLLSCSVTQIL